MGGAFILMGAMVALAAFGLGPMSSSGRNAPEWIVSLCGAFFIACGALLLRPGPLLAQFIAAVSVSSITVVFAWIALFGDSRYFSSDWSFLAPATQVMVARGLFALVALLGLAIMVNAVRTYLNKRT